MSERNSPKAPPSRGQVRSRTVAWAVGLSALCGVGVGAVSGYLGATPGTHDAAPLWFMPAAIALVLTVSIASMIFYWRAIDELARQAHLDAWMWGGSTGLVIAFLFAAMAPIAPPAFNQWLLGGAPEDVLFRGASLVVGAAIAGYGLCWTVYWLRRR
jgi:hypothetical protein